MFGSVTLDVLIGIILIFFLLSIACSAAVEWIAGKRKWRSQTFDKAICQLLHGQLTAAHVTRFFAHPLVRPLSEQPEIGANPAADPHGDPKPDEKRPSYMPAGLFADVLLDLVAKSVPADGLGGTFWRVREALGQATADQYLPANSNLAAALKLFADSAANRVPSDAADPDAARIALLRADIERWYDQTMERAGGWYKRYVQQTLLVMAAVVAIGFNVDTIAITKHLIRVPNARAALVGIAEQTRNKEGAIDASLQQSVKDLTAVANVGVPIGWDIGIKDATNPAFWISKILGIALTIFAVSLGAPFWFDVLNKVSNLRAAGKKPAESTATTGGDGSSGATGSGDAGAPPSAPLPSSPAASAMALAAAPVVAVVTPPKGADTGSPEFWSSDARGRDREDFTTLIDAYDTFASAFLAKAALLAYRPPESLIPFITEVWKFTDCKFIDCRDTQAYVASDANKVVVAFRGTEPTRLRDIIADARIALVEKYGAGNGRVHFGFWTALDCVLKDTLGAAVAAGGKEKQVWVCGHSLGAALATLFALEAQKAGVNVAGVYAYGSPRVGDPVFAQKFPLNKRFFRIVNNEDIVARVAPRAMNYDHVGQFIYLDRNGQIAKSEAPWLRWLNTVVNAMNDFKAAAATTVKDHSMDLYVRKLDNLAAVEKARTAGTGG
jgi:triacylglycerol lipase